MNGEIIDGTGRYRKAFHERAEAGQGNWSNPPTKIRPGVSRIPTGGVLRGDLMPGTSSSRGSKTAMYNPMNSMSFNTNTIAPMVQRSKEPHGERAPKRLRLSESSELVQIHSKSHNREPSLTQAGSSSTNLLRPSTSRGAPIRNQYNGHDGDDSSQSDDPLDLLAEPSLRRPDNGTGAAFHSGGASRRRSEQEVHMHGSVNHRSRSDTNRLVHRQGTPSGNTVFPSVVAKRDKFEEMTPDPKPLPHSTMTMKAQKKSRIANMKGQNGRGRSTIAPVKPRPHGGLPITFTGTEDPLSQPSLSPKRRPKVRKEMILDEGNSTPRRSITGMFFESNPHDSLTDAYIFFHEQGPHLTLQFSGNEMHIFKDDVKWMKTDNLTYLFIGIETGARIHRELEESFLWMPKTLDEGFPSHTISLQFQRRDLEDPDQHINGILDAMSGSERPPEGLASVSVAWSLLESKRKITIKTFDDGSDLTSPSPETGLRPNRSTRNLSTRVSGASKPLTRASGVKKTDLDNDEVMLVYPFTGTGSTQITRGEHQRLRQDEFLNDTLIEFGLRHWLESLKESNPGLAEQVHVFSPFFYKKLKHKDPQAGYNAVKKWTSKVDIFQKRYLVVPINERLHWYLAIIMYPENILRSAKPINQEIEPDIPSHSDFIEQDIIEPPPKEVVEETPESSHPSSRAVSPQQMHVDGDAEMKDSLIPDTIAVPGSSEKAHRTAPSSPGFPEEELLNIPDEEELSPPPDDSWKVSQDTTWILSFDSLGAKRIAALKTLREYLKLEAMHKKGLEIESSVSIISRKVPSPVQPNYCDCGVYLIKTAETFLSRPNEFFQRLLDKNDKLTENHPLWNIEEFKNKRESLFERIAELSLEWTRFKATTEAGKAPRAISANKSKSPNSPTQRRNSLSTDKDSGDEIEIVGEAPAPRRVPRPAPPRLRRTKRLS